MKHKGQQRYEDQGKGQWSSIPGSDAWTRMSHGEEMKAIARNSRGKDKSAASSMGSKGSFDARLNEFMRWGGAKGWTISRKD